MVMRFYRLNKNQFTHTLGLMEGNMINKHLFLTLFCFLMFGAVFIAFTGCDGSSEGSKASVKMIIPDYYNSRIVSIEGMNPTADKWIEVKGNAFDNYDYTFGEHDENYYNNSYNDDFTPSDVDYDSSGKIYIANSSTSGTGGIIRIDDMSDTSGEDIIKDVSVNGLAIDKTINVMYYSTRETLSKIYQKNLNNSDDPVEINTEHITENPIYFNGICPDGEGSLFVSYTSNQNDGFYKIRISDGTILAGTETKLEAGKKAYDITVQNGFVYGITFQGTGGADADYTQNKIIKFNMNLEKISEFHKSKVSNKHFYGPRRFITTTDKTSLYIIDENYIGISPELYKEYGMNRIIAINAIKEDEDWKIFNPSMIDTTPQKDPFEFYMFC